MRTALPILLSILLAIVTIVIGGMLALDVNASTTKRITGSVVSLVGQISMIAVFPVALIPA